MTVVVRPARPGEAATLTALCIRSKAHWAYDDAFMKLSAAALAVDAADIAAGRVLVAAAAKGPALGMAAVLGDGETVDLDSLFVDPPAIGSGAGRLLFQAAASMARGLGARRMTILADPNAVSFYERMGARFVRNAPSDAIPGRLLPLYEYDLISGVEP
ncbi:GNAT family N-acetyltransferase [Reyranella sp.]|uniref:GNAT family N-acetyltransferase n=1 Tax=Reyranella sp. TaxID=1929291 RepID=UPI00120DF079|nr:GNAT family N-acetyltransferase [Reyranella sp.]TAJ81942.1 MAG: GNAT family N-acetyltransferase [Reyranella sp.]